MVWCAGIRFTCTIGMQTAGTRQTLTFNQASKHKNDGKALLIKMGSGLFLNNYW